MELEINEQARRNYALEALTFDEENYLQIRCGGEIIATVCTPSDPGPIQVFNVYNQDGLGEDDVEDAQLLVKSFQVEFDEVQDAYRKAVRFAYAHALTKMMLVDQRLENEIYSIAA